jgi:hypothetical protein
MIAAAHCVKALIHLVILEPRWLAHVTSLSLSHKKSPRLGAFRLSSSLARPSAPKPLLLDPNNEDEKVYNDNDAGEGTQAHDLNPDSQAQCVKRNEHR